jgi:hypothetical protein
MDHNTAEVIQFAMVAGTIITSVLIIAVALTRRRARPADPAALQHIAQRLDRIEQAVDAIAIEVERVSEGQRFTSKLLADRTADSLAGRSIGKTTTPH